MYIVFSSRLPTAKEFTSCCWTLTSDAEWQPMSEQFKIAELAMKSHLKHLGPRYLHFDHHGQEFDVRQIGAIMKYDQSTSDPSADPCLHHFDQAIISY
jgi:hypothetical protein